MCLMKFSITQNCPPSDLLQTSVFSITLPKARSLIWPSMTASQTSNGTTLRHAFGNVLSFFILILIGVLAFSIRLFSTLNTGSLFYATLNAIAYFYMVCSWGGYTFIITLIPMHVLLCIVTGCYSSRLYIAYAPLVVLGTLLATLVPVVGFNAVMTSEHFASFLVFIIIHVVAFVYYIKGILSPKMFKVVVTLVVSIGLYDSLVLFFKFVEGLTD